MSEPVILPLPRPALRWPALLLFTLAFALFLQPAHAQQYASAAERRDAVNARPEPSSTQATLQMTITLGSGQSLSRELQMWASGSERRLIKFTAPADIAGSGFLQIDDASGTQTLVYLPALGRTRRIAGGQQGDSFFGSDFSYEDITGIEPEDYTHTLLEVRGGHLYVVEAVPRRRVPPATTAWCWRCPRTRWCLNAPSTTATAA